MVPPLRAARTLLSLHAPRVAPGGRRKVQVAPGGLEDQGYSPCFQDTFSLLPVPPPSDSGVHTERQVTGGGGGPWPLFPLRRGYRTCSAPGIRPPRGRARTPGLRRGSSSRRSQEVWVRLRGVKGVGQGHLRVITHLDTWLTLDPWRSWLSWLPLQGDWDQNPPSPHPKILVFPTLDSLLTPNHN